jgi:hypothetical protein
MLERISMKQGAPTHQAVHSLIIVAREQQDLWRSLVLEFQDVEYIHILLDRRYGERRRPKGPVAYDRRTRERRNLHRLENDLDTRQYVLVRPHYRRPRD